MSDKIVVIDNDQSHIQKVSCILSGDYEIVTAKTYADVLYQLSMGVRPALFIINFKIEEGGDFEIIEKLHSNRHCHRTPVIIIANGYNETIQEKGFENGAFDFIAKPYMQGVLKARVRHAVEMFHLQNELWKEVKTKTAEITKQKDEAEEMLAHVVDALISTIEAKDLYTMGHSVRVSNYSELLAREIGAPENIVCEIARAGALHDIGKISIPVGLLSKDGHLTTEEYEKIKKHAAEGERILKNIKELGIASDVARHHHERYDGTGYPDGIKGEEISLPTRIVAIADAFDVMNSGRVYQAALSTESAAEEIERCSGTQFDPYLAEVFVRLIREGKVGRFDREEG